MRHEEKEREKECRRRGYKEKGLCTEINGIVKEIMLKESKKGHRETEKECRQREKEYRGRYKWKKRKMR